MTEDTLEDPRLRERKEKYAKKKEEEKRLAAADKKKMKKGYKKLEESAGPIWFLNLSTEQHEAIDTLVTVMRDDMSDCQTYRTINQFGKIGVWPKPSARLVKKALEKSNGQVLSMLFIIFKSFGNKDPFVKYESYTLNEMVVLSAVTHLTLGTAIRDLDFRLPEQLPGESPSKLWVAELKQEPSKRPPVSPLWKKKKARLRVYLEPQPWPKFPTSKQLPLPNTLSSCLAPYDKPSEGLFDPRPNPPVDHQCICGTANCGDSKKKRKKRKSGLYSDVPNTDEDDTNDPEMEPKKSDLRNDGSDVSAVVMHSTTRTTKSPFKQMAAIMEHSPEECKALGCIKRYDAIKKQLQSEWCGCGRPIIPGMSSNKKKRSKNSEFSNSRRGDSVKKFIKNAVWDAAYMDPDIIEKLYQVSVAYDKDDTAGTSAKDGQEHPGGEGEEYDAASSRYPDACPGVEDSQYSPEEQEYINRLKDERGNYTLSKNPKKQEETLVAVLEAMRADDILVAKLPDAHKISYLKMFMQMRCGYIMTRGIKAKLLQSTLKNKKIIEKWKQVEIPNPTPEQVTCTKTKCGCDERYLENYDFHDRMRARAKELLNIYHSKIRQLYVKNARVFWTVMESIKNCTSLTGPMFYSYFPCREIDVFTLRPWQTNEKRGRSLPCGRKRRC